MPTMQSQGLEALIRSSIIATIRQAAEVYYAAPGSTSALQTYVAALEVLADFDGAGERHDRIVPNSRPFDPLMRLATPLTSD